MVIHGNGHSEESTANQLKNPPVGSGGAVIVPFAVKLVGPSMVMAMSDGVWKYVGWERVKDLAARFRGKELVEAVQEQARLLRTRQFQDDFTVVLLEGRA
jgi:PPM family protein phosphatase